MELIAHRGASAIAPESTRAALAAAVSAQADMVELDVQMTKDRRLVIFHDDRLERTSSGRGWLTHKTYAQLAKLDTGSWFAKRFSGERILLVSQLFKLLPKAVRVNLELKKTTHPQILIDRLMRIIGAMSVAPRVIISSFDQKLLFPFIGSPFSYSLICSRQPQQSLRQAIRLRCQAWHLRDGLATPKLIKAAHAAGLKIRIWTVDEPRRARQLIRWGVDGIFTNNPKKLKQVTA